MSIAWPLRTAKGFGLAGHLSKGRPLCALGLFPAKGHRKQLRRPAKPLFVGSIPTVASLEATESA